MMFFLIIITLGIIIIMVGEELGEHLLNVVQGFLLNFGGLLLSFHTPMKIHIVVLISLVD